MQTTQPYQSKRAVIAVLSLVLLVGVGFIAYYLWNQNQQLKEQNAATIAQQSISQDLPSTTQQVAKTDFYTLTTIGD